ncbi:MAG: 2-hydroxychromene-2-carboxylate isomerase [Betaproteobacteria bacterium]|nr:2-hydroxychromene-2-carboxylate isomerase [Betaproteobacteria bacterium]
MSLQTLLTPWVSQWLLSPERLQRQRARAERQRRRRGAAHEILYFHQVDDPYSALAAQSLPLLAQRYEVQIRPFLVPAPGDDVAPERERLEAYSRDDAQWLAAHHGLHFRDPGQPPSTRAVQHTAQQLLQAIIEGTFVDRAGALSRALWQSQDQDSTTPMPPAPRSAALSDHLQQAQRLRERLGHYLGATFYCAGEWYWGIDRLHHLEQRLQALGATRQTPLLPTLLYPPAEDLRHDVAPQTAQTLEFFFSFRSPYSAIVAERVFELARHTGAQVQLRYVLPMVMRGLPVPQAKRRHIALDTAREARARGIAFGRLQDPVGRPTERGLALITWAERHGRGQAYVLAFMHGVWARGLDAGSERGLRQIVEAAGLPWHEARQALQDNTWRQIAENNRQALLAMGLWGVPSFRVGHVAVWGQDRLARVQNALLPATPEPPA